MPVVLRIGPYTFFFYSRENNEPPHIHVKRDECIAKFWLNPVSLSKAGGLRAHEVAHIGHLVEENREVLLEAWNAYFAG
jgi:hypothetical protein